LIKFLSIFKLATIWYNL